ncbi:uncharacterized protein LOC134725057 [Mytilus trossulus]|uniref:uncharacterized protein LOC134725057 n=1 Tax=Mytilus trossulus TaxID=6551 RepID=UPI0030058E27
MPRKNRKTRHGDGGETGTSDVMLETLENQVSETKDIMSNNIIKMHEREGKLEDLESRAGILSEQTTAEFKKLAVKTRQKAKKKSKRLTYILVGVIVTAVALIILILVLYGTGALGDS